MADQAGEVNVYACTTPSCGWKAITRNRDTGTTPMFVQCEKCTGVCKSAFYRTDQDQEPTHEWFKPKTAAERKKIRNAMTAEHVANGGLLLRKLVN